MLKDFCSLFTIDILNCKETWDKKEVGLKYLRNHFLFLQSSGEYLLLNPGFLIDKMYQGLIFDIWNIIFKSPTQDDVSFHDFSEFKSIIGTDFTERQLFYDVVNNSFTDTNIMKFSGEYLKSKDVLGEPDFYMREGNSIFIFECKDALFPDRVKVSSDSATIEKAIQDRICSKNKGCGQILTSIENIVVNHSMDEIDRAYEQNDIFYPIIVTTDRTFDSLGVNDAILLRYSQLKQKEHPTLNNVSVKWPVIVNIGDLINLMYSFHLGKIHLKDLLEDYLHQFRSKLSVDHQSSFSNFIGENIPEYQKMSKEEICYFFSILNLNIPQNRDL
ncbi:hypothetical protein NG821_11510 [Prevotella cerevisiae]|uniref:Restriction endonuclease n=1 Tax=Segatella cerevisiae TaxID=2053716 RepID=A0ABT1BZE3_9BACT|nr:hypothetical protein [Segatella cerevisiae]MCO6026453.1 hypothetical protein [Segatella cerevisiae]